MVDVCAIQSAGVYVDSSLDTLGKTEINSKARRYVLPLNSSGDKVHINIAIECLVEGLNYLGFKLGDSERHQSICNTAK